MNLEVKIINNMESVKAKLQQVSEYYQQDFLLEEIVFITINDLSELDSIRDNISIKPEEFAYQYKKE